MLCLICNLARSRELSVSKPGWWRVAAFWKLFILWLRVVYNTDGGEVA